MSDDRSPDEGMLTAFEHRLAAGQGLTAEETLALIAEVRRLRAEQSALAEVLAPLRLWIGQHPTDPRPDQWYYRIGDLAGGPVADQRQALRAAFGHWISECALCREEVEALAPAIAALHRQVAAGDGLR